MSEVETETTQAPQVAIQNDKSHANDDGVKSLGETPALAPKVPISGRLYVGNIDFQADEAKLEEFLAERGIENASVELPSKTFFRGKKRFTKYLGFGFVQLASEEAADKAFEELNGAEFCSRFIYVKRAVPPATEEEKQKKTLAYLAKHKEWKAQQREKKKAEKAAARAHSAAQSREEANVEDASAKNMAPEQQPKEESAKFTEKAKVPTVHEKKERLPKKPKSTNGNAKPRDSPSPDVVYLTNVGYHATMRLIRRFLKSLDLEFIWIHIPKRTLSPLQFKSLQEKKALILNRGIALVKFKDHAEQEKAILQLNGYKFLGKELNATVAMNVDQLDKKMMASLKKQALEETRPEPGEKKKVGKTVDGEEERVAVDDEKPVAGEEAPVTEEEKN